MKLNYFYFALIITFLIFSACRKDDDQSPEIPDYPIRLAYIETGELSAPMLMTFGTDDIPANTNLSITQMTQDIVSSNRPAFPDSIVLVSDELCYFDAADGGFLSVQMDLDSISYTLTNNNFQFNLVSSDKVVSGTGTKVEIKIPYRTFIKRGTGSSGGGHIPVSYDNFFFTDFFPGDSLVYIQYDVIYKLVD